MNDLEPLLMTIVLSDNKNAGTVKELWKDFNIYQKSKQGILLRVLVPKSLIGDKISNQYFDTSGQMISESGMYTALKMGMVRVNDQGKKTKTESFYLRFIKEIKTKKGEFYIYERMLPNAFTLVAGTGINAPKIVFNLVNILNNISIDSSGVIIDDPTIVNKFTTQECRVDVLPSTDLDQDISDEPGEMELLQGKVDDLLKNFHSKADKDVVINKYDLKENLSSGITFNTNGYKTPNVLFLNAEYDLPNIDYGTDNFTGAVLVTNTRQEEMLKQVEVFFYDTGISQRIIELNQDLSVKSVGEWSIKVDRKQDIKHVGEFLYVDKQGNINFTKALKDLITKSQGELLTEDTSSYDFSSMFNVTAINKEEVIVDGSDELKAVIKEVDFDLENGTLNFERYNGKNFTIQLPTKLSQYENDTEFITKDVNNLTNYTLTDKVGNKLTFLVDPLTYVLTVNLLNPKGEVISSGQVDLPLESMVISASYENGYITLTLQNGETTRFSIAALVSGLVPTTRKINGKSLESDIELFIPENLSDLIEDDAHRTVTDTEKTKWNNKVDIVSGKGLSTNDFTNDYKNKLDSVSSGANANVQPDWNETNNASDAYIKNKPIIPEGAKLYSEKGNNTDGAMTQKAATETFAILKSNQTFTGVNTFGNSTISKFGIEDVNKNPTATQYQVVNWGRDKKDMFLGVEHFAHTKEGNLEHQIDVRRVMTNADGSTTTKYSALVAGLKSDGTAYTRAVSPSSSSNSSDIATTYWVNTKLGDYAKLKADQTFSGNNTFTNEIVKTQPSGFAGFKIKNTGYKRGSVPSANLGLGRFIMYDSDDQYLAYIQTQVNTSGTVQTNILARQTTEEGGSSYKTCSLILFANKTTTWANISAQFQPASTNQYSLGEPNFRWKAIYLSGKIDTNYGSTSYILANQGNVPLFIDRPAGSFNMIANVKSTNGTYLFGAYQTAFRLYFTTKSIIDAGQNSTTRNWAWNEDGTMTTTAPDSSDNSTKVPTTAWVNNAINNLKTYDLIIRTQAEFNSFTNSIVGGTCTAKSVLFVGDGGTLVFKYTGTAKLTLPQTLRVLDGINNAIITMTSVSNSRNSSTSGHHSAYAIGYAYKSRPQDYKYRVSNITFNITSTSGIYATAISRLTNLYNVTLNYTNTYSNNNFVDGFYDCENLMNCVSNVTHTLTSTSVSTNSTSGFNYCKNLINCYSNVVTNATNDTTPLDSNTNTFGFRQCEGLVNCDGVVGGNVSSGDSLTIFSNNCTDVPINFDTANVSDEAKASNYYIKHSNGELEIHMSVQQNKGTAVTHTFPIPFKENTKPKCFRAAEYSGSSSISAFRGVSFDSVTNTNFKMYSIDAGYGGDNIMVSAYGFWK